jgi:iron(III) transport system substrate-binding protein
MRVAQSTRSWYGVRAVQVGALGFLLCSCDVPDHRRPVVLYTSVDEGYAREVIARFQELNREIRVDLVSDTEAAKSTGLVNRLLAEKGRPVADVFWSGDPMRAAALVRAGAGSIAERPRLLTAYRMRMILINRERAGSEPTWPRSLLDFARPEFAPRSCLANPLFGTSSMHAAALFEWFGDRKAQQFFEDFANHGGVMLASNGEVRRRVASGEFAFGITDSDDVSVAITDGKPVGFVIPDAETLGAVVISTVPLVIAGAPHPKEAEELARFLGSVETEEILARSTAAHFPGDPAVKPPQVFEKLSATPVKQALLNFDELAARMEELQKGFLREWVARQTSE